MVPFFLRSFHCFIFCPKYKSSIQQGSFPFKKVWFPLAPPKVQSFLWKRAWVHALSSDRVQKFYPHFSLSPNICFLCLSDLETNNHLFLHYPVVKRMWENLFRSVNLSWVFPKSAFPFGLTMDCSSSWY